MKLKSNFDLFLSFYLISFIKIKKNIFALKHCLLKVDDQSTKKFYLHLYNNIYI